VSSIFRGEQMVQVIDALEIDVTVVGNHDYVIKILFKTLFSGFWRGALA